MTIRTLVPSDVPASSVDLISGYSASTRIAVPEHAESRGNPSSDRIARESRLPDTSGDIIEEGSTAHKRVRASKACERCQKKRIKCSGTSPCHACIRSGEPSSCAIRLRARQARFDKKVASQFRGLVNADTCERGTGEQHEGSGLGTVVPDSQDHTSSEYAVSPSVDLLHRQTAHTDVVTFGARQPHPFSEAESTLNATTSQALDSTTVHLYGSAVLHNPLRSITPAAPVQTSIHWPTDDPSQELSATTRPLMPEHVQGSRLDTSKSPLSQIETLLSAWCLSTGTFRRPGLREFLAETQGVDIEKLVLNAESQISTNRGTPLPASPTLEAFEDLLFNSLFANVGSRGGKLDVVVADSAWIVSLYRRYRAIPHALTEDQRALIHSLLCVARFALIRSQMNIATDGEFTLSRNTREDITYYHLALAALRRWNQQSLTALKAYFYLQIFTVGAGSPADTKEIQTHIGHQIVTLGLHKKESLELYPPEEKEQAIAYVSASLKSDHFRAILTDLEPSIPLANLDVNIALTNPDQGTDPHDNCSRCTARYLADYASSTNLISDPGYISRTMDQWQEQLRSVKPSLSGRIKEVDWADFRFNWIRILLYIPLLSRNDKSSDAYAVILRCLSRIFHVYYDLVELQELNPSWPQVARLVVCGQLLILASNAEELHRREAENMFKMLIHLLELHRDAWPACHQLTTGMKAAARKLLGTDFDDTVSTAMEPKFSQPSLPATYPSSDDARISLDTTFAPQSWNGDLGFPMPGNSNIGATGAPLGIADMFLGSFDVFPWNT